MDRAASNILQDQHDVEVDPDEVLDSREDPEPDSTKREDLPRVGPVPERAVRPARRAEVTGQVLHLSDLHFGTPDNARNWHTAVAEDLKHGLDCAKLDALILSGDIANRSTPEEYAAARLFLEKLSAEFGLTPQQIIPVPGNHDLNWSLAHKAYRLVEREEVRDKLEEGRFYDEGPRSVWVRDEALYPQRFKHFAAFYQAVRREPYPLDPGDQGLLYHLPAQNLLVLGLNSAWNLDDHFTGRAQINGLAVSNALDRIRKEPAYQDKDCLKIAVWHHPVNSPDEDRITHHDFLQSLAKADFLLGLHGHIHKADSGLYRYDRSPGGRRLELCGAGTFGAPISQWVPGYPLQYQLLRFAGDTLTVETRCREELDGAWRPDARWTTEQSKDPEPRYRIRLGGSG
jgi:predicted MPP superfamily phosphohydrolase